MQDWNEESCSDGLAAVCQRGDLLIRTRELVFIGDRHKLEGQWSKFLLPVLDSFLAPGMFLLEERLVRLRLEELNLEELGGLKLRRLQQIAVGLRRDCDPAKVVYLVRVATEVRVQLAEVHSRGLTLLATSKRLHHDTVRVLGLLERGRATVAHDQVVRVEGRGAIQVLLRIDKGTHIFACIQLLMNHRHTSHSAFTQLQGVYGSTFSKVF